MAGVDHKAAAWVDPHGRLYPPAAADHGVPLERLLVVRPPDDGAGAWAWATEQLLRSGCFPLVVLDHPAPPKTPQRALSQGLSRAAEHGGSLLLVVSARPVKALPADVRLGVGGVVRVQLTIDASGKVVKVRLLGKGLGHGLDELALTRARALQFDPALDSDDRPVASVLTWTFRFEVPA